MASNVVPSKTRNCDILEEVNNNLTNQTFGLKNGDYYILISKNN